MPLKEKRSIECLVPLIVALRCSPRGTDNHNGAVCVPDFPVPRLAMSAHLVQPIIMSVMYFIAIGRDTV